MRFEHGDSVGPAGGQARAPAEDGGTQGRTRVTSASTDTCPKKTC
jgi:hypothetical protein